MRRVYCNFTEECDNHRNDRFSDTRLKTYLLFDALPDEYIVFRIPGATRGGIKLDENGIITEILFNDNAYKDKRLSCYEDSVVEVKDKFIGTKLVIKTEMDW